MNKKERMIELSEYFIDNGIHVIALDPGKKYPTYKNWQRGRLSKEQMQRAINKGYGVGIIPHGDFVVVDIDTDHKDGSNGLDYYNAVYPNSDTLTAYKDGSNNEHRFYQNTYSLNVKLVSNEAIIPGVEIFTKNQQITTLPFYEFDNLDMSRPFLEQLSASPKGFEQLHKYEHKQREVHQSNFTHHNIENYLAKIKPFEAGSRSESYRKLMFTMVVKNRMPYEDVYEAIRDWDAKTIDYQSEEPYQFEHAIREPK